jgi:hypothetical protein
MTEAAMAFADWSESEAQRRIATLLRTGWSARQLAQMFGVSVEEIDRLSGADVIPPAAVDSRGHHGR